MFCTKECWNCEEKECKNYRSKEKLYFEYQQLLETSKAYNKLLKTTMKKEHQAIKVLDEIREQLKKIKPDLDFEPWSIYTINGNKLFDLVQILDKVEDL